jgi:hypothetical protein
MPTLFKRSQNWIWYPDADATNAPDGALLRAQNTVPDETGGRALRAGKSTLYTGLQEQRVQSLHTPTLQGTTWRLAGIDDQVYRNGSSFGTSFDGGGDISFGDDAYQAFAARGTTKKKFDGTTLNNWGIAAPSTKATLAAISATTGTVATFDSGESPAFTINEGTSNFVNNYAGSASSALELVPNLTSGRASCSKKFGADTDYLDLGGGLGGETDLFDFRAWLEEPRKVDKIAVMFGLNTGTDPFLDDYYFFEFQIRNDGKVAVKEEQPAVVQAYKASTDKLLENLTPEQITGVQTPEAAGAIVKRLTSFVGQSSFERPDSQEASPAWGHFTVTRGQFKRVGKTSGRDWKTVRGFKVVYTVIPGSDDSLYLDDAIWTGGGDRSLTGTFRVGYRFARQFNDVDGNEIYTELSPMSPLSDELTLAQQAMQITIPSAALTAKDAQVNKTWIYVYGGWLDTFYRFAVTSATVNSGMTIDELTNPAGSNFDQIRERARLVSHGFTYSQTSGDGVPAGVGNTDIIVTLRKSEVDALIEGEVFEPGSVGPPDNIIGVAGPWNGRMFVLTSEGWLYPSSQKRPSSFSIYHTLDLRKYGTPYWVIKTTGGVYVGCSEDIIRIAGTGAESNNHVSVDLVAQELNVANPPVDSAVTQDGNAILYRSADGPQMFSGASVQPLPFAGTSLLWKGYNRHGVSSLNTEAGRFRFAVDNHNLYMLAPEERVSKSTVTITSSSGTATVTHTAHSFATNDQVKISGATEETYNGVKTITVTGDDNYTYTVVESATSPAATASGGLLTAIKATDPASVWKYQPDMSPPQWSRLYYAGEKLLSIHREETGQLLVGTATGDIWEIETEGNDDGTAISVDIQTPWLDDGNALIRKDSADLQVHLDTGGSAGIVALYKDGAGTATQTISTVATSIPDVYRADARTLGTFIRMQFGLTGSFQTFLFHGFALSYRARPQQVMVLDTGHIVPPNGGDVAWITEVEIDTYSPADLQMLTYKGSTLFDTATIPVTANIRDVYRLTTVRDSKGRRLRLVFLTTNSNGASNPGFEPYGIRVRHKGAGNLTELPIGAGDQGNV